MTVEYGNIFYFIFIAVSLSIFFGFYFLLKGKSKRFVYWFLFGILAFNFCLHFAKLLFEPYRSKLPILLRKITPENICALSTLTFPFVYLSKNKVLKDYVFYMGVLSGLIATFVPVEAIGFSPVSFDVIRFYVCHTCLWIAPLLMVIHGIHTLDYRRIWKVPAVFIGVLCVITVNEVIIFRLGLLDDKFTSLEDMFNPAIRNSSFIFGPTPNLEKVAVIATALCPKFMKVSIMTGETMYWPVLWLVIPSFVYLPVIFLGFSWYWEKDRIKADVKWAAVRVRYARTSARARRKGLKPPPRPVRPERTEKEGEEAEVSSVAPEKHE